MKIKLSINNVFLFLFTITSFEFAQIQNLTPKIILPNEINFNSTEQKDYAIETFNLIGNPSENEFYVQIVKIPSNTKLNPHFHPDNRTVFVLEGEFYYCYEDKFDEARAKKIIKGSFFTEPSNQPHFAFTKESNVILHVTGFGPTKTTFIKNK